MIDLLMLSDIVIYLYFSFHLVAEIIFLFICVLKLLKRSLSFVYYRFQLEACNCAYRYLCIRTICSGDHPIIRSNLISHWWINRNFPDICISFIVLYSS